MALASRQCWPKHGQDARGTQSPNHAAATDEEKGAETQRPTLSKVNFASLRAVDLARGPGSQVIPLKDVKTRPYSPFEVWHPKCLFRPTTLSHSLQGTGFKPERANPSHTAWFKNGDWLRAKRPSVRKRTRPGEVPVPVFEPCQLL